jgi:hypothetical protein
VGSAGAVEGSGSADASDVINASAAADNALGKGGGEGCLESAEKRFFFMDFVKKILGG